MEHENPCQGLLEIGKEYTYKELCGAVYDKQVSGNSKKSQLKKWARHFSWEHPLNPKTGKPTKKFLIKEVYEEVLPEEDGRRCEYDLSDIILMLLNGSVSEKYLHYQGTEDFYAMGITKTKLNELVGLCNEKYIEVMNTPIADIPATTHKDFFRSTNSSFDSIVRSNFNSLQRKGVLLYTEGLLWYDIYYDAESGEHGRRYHLATDKEHTAIMDARNAAIKKWNEDRDKKLSTYGEVFFKLDHEEQKIFNHLVRDYLQEIESLKSFRGAYSCHKATFRKRAIKREMDKRNLTPEEQELLMNTLRRDINEQMVTKVLESSRSRYDKAIDAKQSKQKIIDRESGFGRQATPVSLSMELRLQDSDYVKHCDSIAAVVIPLEE